MPIVVNGETYYTASEAAKYVGVSRPTFYQNIQPQLPEYKHGAMRRVHYRQSDLEQYKSFQRVEVDTEE